VYASSPPPPFVVSAVASHSYTFLTTVTLGTAIMLAVDMT